MTIVLQAPMTDARGVVLEIGQVVVYSPATEKTRMKTARIAKLGKKVGLNPVDNNSLPTDRWLGAPYVEDDLDTYLTYTNASCVVVVDALPYVVDRMNT